MFWMRNKKIKFLLRTLSLSPDLVQLIKLIRKALMLFSHPLIFTECVQLLLYGGG